MLRAVLAATVKAASVEGVAKKVCMNMCGQHGKLGRGQNRPHLRTEQPHQAIKPCMGRSLCYSEMMTSRQTAITCGEPVMKTVLQLRYLLSIAHPNCLSRVSRCGLTQAIAVMSSILSSASSARWGKAIAKMSATR